MISVAEALQRILDGVHRMPTESINLADAHGRVLARDVTARLTQPPADVSAMDGYAVRAADVAEVPVSLTQIGESAAGSAFEGTVGPGQTARIFTGAPVPKGADAIVIQEDTETDGDQITMKEAPSPGQFVRPAGLDFSRGDVGIPANRVLSARDVGLAAAMNVPWLTVARRPRIALLATGDEIVRPGEPVGPNQIISSNTIALMGLIKASGGEAIDLGIARDDEDSLRALASGARGADMLVTLGGASVGDHDLVRKVLGQDGLELDFWRIAMRPGKPLIFGRIGETPMMGMPGNPVSSLVCGIVYLRPAIRAMLGLDPHASNRTALLGEDLPANDQRQDYLRATATLNEKGETVVKPFEKQDSSMLSRLAKADCLVLRPPHAEAANAGERVEILPLNGETTGI
ncbi:MAG: molybdopterin molybdotransferase MoeA [Alphaproteobacteria bacterium]|jgi:molybdopterin molybdotransferase|nr:molybdopterin molybdotransferase MoeA [Alphaproteobacteria bacterium]MDP6830249.1 molybdopterin molybdotransferase MoeA [Alphaproteobacteria bacterium]